MSDIQDAITRLREGLEEFESEIPRRAYDNIGLLYGSVMADLDSLEDILQSKPTETYRFWEIVNPSSMFLIALIELTEHNGEVVYGKIIWSIKQFWIWKFLFERKITNE